MSVEQNFKLIFTQEISNIHTNLDRESQFLLTPIYRGSSHAFQVRFEDLSWPLVDENEGNVNSLFLHNCKYLYFHTNSLPVAIDTIFSVLRMQYCIYAVASYILCMYYAKINQPAGVYQAINHNRSTHHNYLIYKLKSSYVIIYHDIPDTLVNFFIDDYFIVVTVERLIVLED